MMQEVTERANILVVEDESLVAQDLSLRLKDLGYEVLDYFYTAGSIELRAKSRKNYVARLPRRLFFAIHPDLAVRIMGGHSLMVLGK